MKFESNRSKINTGELRVPATFYEYRPNEGPEPGEDVKHTLFTCFVRVDEVYKSQLEQAKANETLNDVTITMRDPLDSYEPDEKHRFDLDMRGYKGKHFNIKKVQPDSQNFGYLTLIASARS